MLDSKASKMTSSPNRDEVPPNPENDKIPSISGLEEDILTALVGRNLYGLQICAAIEEASEGHQLLKIGSLYPSLHRLEKKQLISSWMEEKGGKSRRGNRRKYYQITSKGLGALSQKRRMRERLIEWRPSTSLQAT